mgnify:CR=1 FL=1
MKLDFVFPLSPQHLLTLSSPIQAKEAASCTEKFTTSKQKVHHHHHNNNNNRYTSNMRVKDGALVVVEPSPESSPMDPKKHQHNQNKAASLLSQLQSEKMTISAETWESFAELFFAAFPRNLTKNFKLVEDDDEVRWRCGCGLLRCSRECLPVRMCAKFYVRDLAKSSS